MPKSEVSDSIAALEEKLPAALSPGIPALRGASEGATCHH
jgi:hypothetical protein